MFLSIGIILQLSLHSQESKQLEQITEKFDTFMNKAHGERVYLQIDKSIYQPGETVWFTAYLQNENDLEPSSQSEILHVEIINPKGNVQQEINLICKSGSVRGDFSFDENLPGGMYQIKAFTEWQKNDKEPYFFTKDIQLQKFILPNLLMEVEFAEKGYGPGDMATAKVEMKDLENSPIAEHEIDWEAFLNGASLFSEKIKTDEEGNATVEIKLPENLETSEGLLNITIDYDGVRESISRSIPIVLNRIQFELYPEGGDLVDGQNTRIGFQALNEYDKPTDIEGKVVDIDGNEISQFKSFHRGMGVFDFLPEQGKEYFAKIDKPEGVHEIFPLPEVLKSGYTMNVLSASKDSIHLTVQSKKDENIILFVQVRGEVYYAEYHRISSGINHFTISSTDFPMGVAQITLFDNRSIAQAERLLFVNKHKKLNIQLSTNKQNYKPREKVSLDIKVMDENRTPVAGSFSLAVTDEKLISMANDKSGTIISKLLLEPDIKGDVDEPDYYFDDSKSKSDQALDYLLMTKGWRRFSWKEVLSNKEPLFAYDYEQAIIQGYLYDTRMKNPVKNKKIKIENLDLTVKTDKSGFFKFEGIDLTEKLKLTYKDEFNISSEYIVASYNDNLLIDVSKEYRFKETSNKTNRATGVNNTSVASGTAAIKGQVIDANTKAPIPFANIVVQSADNIVAGTTSDFDGYYTIKPVPAGRYDLKSTYVGYYSHIIKGVQVQSKQIIFLDIELDQSAEILDQFVSGDPADDESSILVRQGTGEKGSISTLALNKGYYNSSNAEDFLTHTKSNRLTQRIEKGEGISLEGVVITAYQNPLIPVDQTISGRWMTDKDIEKMSFRSTEALASTVGGVFSIDGERGNIRGARRDQTVVYIDGVKVLGSSNLPQSAIAEVAVYLGGVPAEYGDFRGGVIDITTKSYFSNYVTTPRYQPRETIEIPNFPIYYRAREFPEIAYKKVEKEIERSDFRTTIFWDGDIQLDEKGTANIEFYNSDATTTFNITIEGVSHNGLVGRATTNYFTQMPFSINAKVPVSTLMEDKIIVPVHIQNSTEEEITGIFNFKIPPCWETLKELPTSHKLKPKSSEVIYLKFKVLDITGKHDFSIGFDSENGILDTYTIETEVNPRGFPVYFSYSGNEMEDEFELDIVNPIQGSIKASFTTFPSNLANLSAGIESMLRQPHGCFEQVSSSTYPNLLVLDFLEKSEYENEKIKAKAMAYIKDGYKKLAAYECPNGGFDWYGKGPGHEGLTAYGLMEFVDMQNVYNHINQQMIERTKEWLLDKRDGNGGFRIDSKHHLHSWAGQQDVFNAYILWALSEAGVSGIEKEANHSINQAKLNKDPYQLALMAMVCYNLNYIQAGDKLVEILLSQEDYSGGWTGINSSMTCSSGKSLKVETTSLAILAMIQSTEHQQEIDNNIDLLLKYRTGGRFGSTQATVLALKALTAYYENNKESSKEGLLSIAINGVLVKEQIITGLEKGEITIAGLEEYLNEGQNKIAIQYNDMRKALPFSFNTNYSTSLPKGNDYSILDFNTSLSQSSINLGDISRMSIVLTNNSDETIPFPIAIIGIPAGLVLQPWQLKEYSDQGDLFEYYETWGNDIVLYFSHLNANETKSLNFDLKSEIPGNYKSSASVAYLYYNDEEKYWVDGNTIEIKHE